ncbi:hypothetical protein [Aquabacterium sp. OR-4]|uniref:hypothetical protein n=1 Tax=Aquabacterium sp. OR-4 TaxID=2978127 RepID=UPI0021B1F85B|nr:hypothetical protein [Aquabacterium sp. OR-4]MDT7838753.1 hypothetical protein [Aquabacterium sp. OR-4]
MEQTPAQAVRWPGLGLLARQRLRQAWPQMRAGARHGLPVVLWLACILYWCEQAHLFHAFDEWAMSRALGRQIETRDAIQWQTQAAKNPWLTRLVVRDQAHEPISSDQTRLRLDQDKPFSRVRLAEYLEQLNKSLPAEPPSVIGIDVDVTPLEDSPSDAGSAQRLKNALLKLAERHVVVAAALDRREQAHVAARNAFMRDLCTGANKQGQVPRLAFASIAVASERGKALIDVPYESRNRKAPTSFHSGAVPAVFPSLGVVLGEAAARYVLEPGANGGAPTTRWGQQDDQHGPQTLTTLCQQANGSQPTTLDLAAAASDGASTLPHYYEPRHLNTARADPLIQTFEIDSPADLLHISLPTRVLLISVDDDTASDQHLQLRLTDATRHLVPGDRIHAVTAIGRAFPLQPSHGLAWLVDLAVGMVFAALGHALKPGQRMRRHYPMAGLCLGLIGPLALGGLGCWLADGLSAKLLWQGVWLLPVPMMVGMALHAYGEAGMPAHDHDHGHEGAHGQAAPSTAQGRRNGWATVRNGASRLRHWLTPPAADAQDSRSRADQLAAWWLASWGTLLLVTSVLAHLQLHA